MSLQTEVLVSILPLNSPGVISPAVLRKAASFERRAAALCKKIVDGGPPQHIAAPKSDWSRDDFAAPVPPPEAQTDALALELSIKRDEIRQRLLDAYPGFIDSRGREWPGSPIDMAKFAYRVEAAENPMRVLERAAGGGGSPDQAMFMQEIYPEIYSMFSMLLLSSFSPEISPSGQARADTFLLGRREAYTLGDPISPEAAEPSTFDVNKDALTSAQKIAAK